MSQPINVQEMQEAIKGLQQEVNNQAESNQIGLRRIVELEDAIRKREDALRVKDMMLSEYKRDAIANSVEAVIRMKTSTREGRESLGLRSQEERESRPKPPKGLPPCRYTSDKDNFTVFRNQFKDIVELYDYSPAQKKVAVFCCLKGEAAEAVLDLREMLENEEVDYEDVLDALEGRFNPEMQQEAATTKFEQALQMKGENLLRWHARLRHLFQKAFPDKDLNDATLIRKFVNGIRDNIIRKQTKRAFCKDYVTALNVAMKEYSVEESEQPMQHGTYRPQRQQQVEPMEIGAIDKSKISCFTCKEKGHMSRDCPSQKKRNKPPFSKFSKDNRQSKWKKAINEIATAYDMLDSEEEEEEDEEEPQQEEVSSSDSDSDEKDF